MRVTLIGCGGWGARIARRLVEFEGVRLVLVDERREVVEPLASELSVECSWDPFGYLGVSGTQTDSTTGGMVIIATPPQEREAVVRAVLTGYGVKPRCIRVEKPIAESVEAAERIVELCDAAGVRLEVGFTLLHDPLYDAAFDYIRANRMRVRQVSGVRIGARPRHRCDALLDQGIHTAAIGAFLGVSARVNALHSDSARMRKTTLHVEGGKIVVDEIAGTITTPDGILGCDTSMGDALHRDLDAWLMGRHRGSSRVGLEAQRTIGAYLEAVAS